MTENELVKIINKLKQENEITWIEAKSNLSDLHKIGKTISALANSASWKDEEYGYLVWGLEDNTWNILGTNFKLDKIKEGNLDGNLWLKERGFDYKCDFEEREFTIENERIYVLKIKNCFNEPLYFFHKDKQAWIAHIREGQNNDELKNFPERQTYICSKKVGFDWSAQICDGATLDDLDEEAIEKAKRGYVEKNYESDVDRKKEIEEYDTNTFLNEAKLNINGKITKTTILLLGKEKSVHYLNTMAEIMWEENGTEAYKKFKLPFIFAIDNLANHIRIRDIEYPIFMAGQQTGQHGKIPNYTFKNLREAISNCVAHQDYAMQEKILVYESVDKITLKNAGKPLLREKDYNELLKPKDRNFAPNKYRNKWLYEAMDTIGLVEGRGSGFRKIFDYSTNKAFLPAPSANFDLQDRFEYTIYGSEIDPIFTKILIEKKDLDIGIILLLDRVQKYSKNIINRPIITDQFQILKKLKLVEGRYPKIYLSAEIMEVLDQKEEYINNKGFDEIYYIDLILSYMEKYSNALRINISRLLENKLPDDGTNKYEKVSNLLRKMKNKNIIEVDKTNGFQNSTWKLTSDYKKNYEVYKTIYKRKT